MESTKRLKKKSTTSLKQNFNLYKKECLKWQKKLELSHYDLKVELGTSTQFTTGWNSVYSDYNTTVYMDKNYKFSSLQEIKDTAKHEMVHVLLGRLYGTATSRYINSEELNEALEEVVRKLSKLL